MNKLLFLFLALPLFFLGGCSDDDDDSGESKTLTLKADKTTIVANSKETVTFIVTDESGKDLTASCNILQGAETLLDNTFKTSAAGTYEFIAQCPDLNNLQSNKVTVTATPDQPVNPSDLKIENDKKTIYADGGDIVLLSLKDAAGTDVTMDAVFYADGKKLESNMLQTTEKKILTITAEYNSQKVTSTVKINAKQIDANTNFTGRLYAELFSSTTCRYCGEINEALEDLFKAEQEGLETYKNRVVPVCVHDVGSEVLIEESTTFVSDFKKYFKADGTPDLYCNRENRDRASTHNKVYKLKELVPESSDAGIAIKTVLNGSEVKVDAFVHANKAIEGKIAAVLVEEGIKAKTNYEYHGGLKTLLSIMRAYAPSFEGKTASFSLDRVEQHTFTFSSSYAKDMNNCAVAVLVMDGTGKVIASQRVKVGEAIGY